MSSDELLLLFFWKRINHCFSKNTVCKELDIPRPNLNRYCTNEFQRLDANLICKLCGYFSCEVGELIVYAKE
ncbi:MAG: helix-turn-helix transcriptional regulator [Lachnospiraceae bacterium]|nr:helix-turn-helix transcriptional regulator [Lachnospiraceae bacterium]